MTPEQEEFNEIFKDKGGIFQVDDSPIRELTDSFHTELKSIYKDMPLINGDIIFNTSLSAFIRYKRNDSTYYLGITVGCYFLILDLFAKMMATKSTLKDVGNISLLNDDKKVINALSDGRGFIYLDHSQMGNNMTRLNDPIRKNYSNAFMTLTLEFVVLHEMAHIIDGHLGYQINSLQNLTWDELQLDENEPRRDSLTSQTLEMRADRIAIYQYYSRATDAIKIVDTLPDELKPIYANMESFLCYLVFALYSFFRLMGFQDFNIENAKGKSHPPPLVRISMVIDTVMAIREVHEVKTMEKEQFITKLIDIISQAEKAYCEVTYTNYDSAFIQENLKLVEDYKRTLYKNFDVFEQILRPYSIIDKSSPVNKL